ncbi:MAG: hypothetical protein IT578_04230 [Verrucomicrobiae bacterium]|nr:hypothetical protein [Verrucomicrobiae bacterium]
MNTPVFVLSLVVAGIALWLHGYRVARRHPPRLRCPREDFLDPDLYQALRRRNRVARRFLRAWSALRGPPPCRPGDFIDPDLHQAMR